ncbi:MAG TPA: glycosyltransferase family 4 protein [Gemmatimonadaceae bacterium]|nr:glycosyltransferase family 4 protein [Gemmatimonadaceae bacterium]
MRILVVNWNDRENPHAGGAEVHLHETFGRIASLGHRVELLASRWDGSSPNAKLDGIEVHRTGTRYSFALAARRYYNAQLASRNYDVIVEDLNKIPLYTPRWGAPHVVPLVHHLFGSTIFREAIFPMASAVWLAERAIPRSYRGLSFIAVSESTSADLVERGLSRADITVIYNGIDSKFFTPDAAARSSYPLFSYVGRLKRYKGVDLVIRAFARVKNTEARLEIAGAGDYRPVLERLSRSLGIDSRVKFAGFISTDEKRDLLRRSWASVFASPKEGWGLTNLEAAAAGTPVIASDSPGLRESLIPEETGILVPHGDLSALAKAMDKIAANRKTVETLGMAGRRFAERFTWERTAEDTLSHLESVVQRGNRKWK